MDFKEKLQAKLLEMEEKYSDAMEFASEDALIWNKNLGASEVVDELLEWLNEN